MERLYKFLKPYFDSGFPSGEILESVEFYLRPEVDFKENPVCNGKFDVSLGKDFKLNDVHWADYDVNSKDWYNFGYRIMCLLTYKECFKLIKENKMWLGPSIHSGDREFMVPNDYPMHAAGQRIDEKGRKFIRVKGVRWFTNLDYEERHQDLQLWKSYDPSFYPKYDNYNAINVDKTNEIPKDYKGAMGVPITFLDKYNPDQFEIIALGIVGSISFTKNIKMEILKQGAPTGKYTFNAKGTLYRKYNPEKDKYPAFKNVITGVLYSSIYARIIIKNKRAEK